MTNTTVDLGENKMQEIEAEVEASLAHYRPLNDFEGHWKSYQDILAKHGVSHQDVFLQWCRNRIGSFPFQEAIPLFLKKHGLKL